MNKTLAADTPGKKALLLGNEAIARGVIEAGAQVVAAYPGTPSSEIVDSLASVANETGQYVEWSTNEKVAFECAAGASFLGVRAFSAMKNVGLNVAMDPLMVVNLTGTAAGFVFVVADDPNCWSTQNEQDSRLLAAAAEIPCLEPASVQEAKDMVVYAYEVSEKLGRAVMIRTVTRLSHSRGLLQFGPLNKERREADYHSKRSGFPALPKHVLLHQAKDQFSKTLSDCSFNTLDIVKGAKIGIIAAGNSVNYAKEAARSLGLEDDISWLKIGVVNPLPADLIEDFLAAHRSVIIFEEIEPFLETQIRSLSYSLPSRPRLIGKLSGDMDIPGELTIENASRVLARVSGLSLTKSAGPEMKKYSHLLVPRDTVLCAGCPHMGAFYAIRKAARRQKARMIISGDIGCYGLGLFAPYNLFDSHICMGASIGIGNGYAAAGYKGPIVCVIGDSTLYHSGMLALVNAVFNRHNITVVVLDNSIIAMTGHQPDPGTGRTATGKPAVELNISNIVRSLGIEEVSVTDPFDLPNCVKAIQKSIEFNGPSVVISKGDCALISGRKGGTGRKEWDIDPEKCNLCGVCIDLLYCPALRRTEETCTIDKALCSGCGVCAQVCPKKAISVKQESTQ